MEALRSRRLQSWMVGIRRELHRQAEPAFKEAKTARILMAKLYKLYRLGIPYSYSDVGGGLIGRLLCGTGVSPFQSTGSDLRIQGTFGGHPFVIRG